ncbi:MAG TPA: hypothetical protein VIP05_31000 [Burkholderiaceae bacterium]
MNATLEIAGFDEHTLAGWMRLELATPAATLITFANEDAPPQFLLGVEGGSDLLFVDRILAALQALDVRRETASAFALPAAIAPFDTLGFVRGPERRLLRGILEDDGVLQAIPMHECELTAEGRLPPLANFRRWTDVLALDRAPQPWFHFRMQGQPSGLDVQQWTTEAWTTFQDYLGILSRDDRAWLEVRNRLGRILRLPDAQGWDRARERVQTHVCRDASA